MLRRPIQVVNSRLRSMRASPAALRSSLPLTLSPAGRGVKFDSWDETLSLPPWGRVRVGDRSKTAADRTVSEGWISHLCPPPTPPPPGGGSGTGGKSFFPPPPRGGGREEIPRRALRNRAR